LASLGVRVAAADYLGVSETVALIEQAGGRALAVQVDVREGPSVASMVRQTLAAFGTVDILVNNAAIAADLERKSFVDIDTAEWDRVMAVNARGTFECIKAVTPHMKEKHYGKIINIASTTYLKGAAMMMSYVASKGAVIGITRVAARELGDHGITVNCIAPGLTMTEPIRAKGDFAGAVHEASIGTRAIKREQVASDLNGALSFLASSQSHFVTGQTIVVDGGNMMP